MANKNRQNEEDLQKIINNWSDSDDNLIISDDEDFDYADYAFKTLIREEEFLEDLEKDIDLRIDTNVPLGNDMTSFPFGLIFVFRL